MRKPKSAQIEGADVPIVKLTPLRKRTISKKNYNRLRANIKAVGLIEPLCVCHEGDQYFILDGYLRYTALLELGIETVPCLVLASRDLYTPNRQVNHLSGRQEIQMLRKALENLDETTIEGILMREQAGKPLHCLAAAQQASRLYDAARRYFGSWREALRSAGIDPETVRRKHRPYTADDIISHLKLRAKEGGDFRSTKQHPEPIVRAARRLFGSWERALEAAGLNSA